MLIDFVLVPFSRTLQFGFAVQCSAIIVLVCRLSVVCDASVLWQNEYRYDDAVFHHSVAQWFNSLPVKFDYKIRSGSPWLRAKLGWDGFWLRDAISRKRCEIGLMWQLSLGLMGSHIGSFDFNKSRWPWITLNVNSLLCCQRYGCCDQTAEARFTRISL